MSYTRRLAVFFFLMIPPPPRSTLFPYTTLFRSSPRLPTPTPPGCRAGRRRKGRAGTDRRPDRKSTRLNSSHVAISYAVFCLKKKKDLCSTGSTTAPMKVTSTRCTFEMIIALPCSTFRFFFFNDTATTEIYTLSLHDALPIALALIAADASRPITCSICSLIRSGSAEGDRKSTRLNSSHVAISYAVFCLKKKKNEIGVLRGEKNENTQKHVS